MRRSKLVLSAVLGLLLSACNETPPPGSGGGGGAPPPSGGPGGAYVLTAWNDLGMHCMDSDYGVFAILPPYNNLHAQLLLKSQGLVASGVRVEYAARTGLDGGINTTSQGKTNFWDHVEALFGVRLPPDVGLKGKPTPSAAPAPLDPDPTAGEWRAEGIPLTPYNDDGRRNFYPLVRVTARDAATGEVLAQVDAVLPVSDEMDCRMCHGSNARRDDAKPKGGWVHDPNPERDYRLNILRLHDERHPGAVKDHQSALAAAGYRYDPAGLEATARGGTPILCAACHASNALPGVGIGLKPLTQAIHGKHAGVTDPRNGLKLGAEANRTACYACHPGATTQCLRGAMGSAKNPDGTQKIQCQDCHGGLAAVGRQSRRGWLDEPNCQACHHDGRRELSALDPATGGLRRVRDARFATNPDTPLPGTSLFRLSHGHGNLACEACHGPTHAVYPAGPADNLGVQALQGHAGTLAECGVCHDPVPLTADGGPHGMHTVGEAWVRRHGDAAEKGTAGCAYCHGADHRGGPLSATWSDRSFALEHGQKHFPKGHRVGCYDCHNGPGGDD